jgi:uncharacterized protein
MKPASRSDSIFKFSPALVVLALFFAGCTNFVFQPDNIVYSRPKDLGLDFHDVFLRTSNDIQIHGWFLRAKGGSKGTVYVLHGNAQNITAHVRGISWLPDAGYHVFLLDYRGYGNSTGEPEVQGAVQDIGSGLSWLLQNPEVKNKPLFLLGQSLGAALGVYFIGSHPEAKHHLTGVVLDAGFSRYRTIAREKFADSWLTWLFQYPLSLLFSDKYDPEDYIAKIAPVPLLIMHSKKDGTIPFHHGKELFELAGEPKFFMETDGGHIDTFHYEHYRIRFLEFLDFTAGLEHREKLARVPAARILPIHAASQFFSFSFPREML